MLSIQFDDLYCEITILVDEDRAADTVHLDFIKVFDMIFHKSLLKSLIKYWLDEQAEVNWKVAERMGLEGGEQ